MELTPQIEGTREVLEGYTGFGGLTVYGLPFEAESDAAVFSFQAVAVGNIGGSGEIAVTVLHRNADETSYSTNTSDSVTSAGVFGIECTGLKRWVRFKVDFIGTFQVDTGGGTGSAEAPELHNLRVLDPVWFQKQT